MLIVFITFFKKNFPHPLTLFQHSFHSLCFYCNCFIFTVLYQFSIKEKREINNIKILVFNISTPSFYHHCPPRNGG
jgi:hypothetical protein